MSFRHLEAMQLEAERVRAAADFLDDYGRLCVHDLQQLESRTSRTTESGSMIGPVDDDQRWAIQADAASAFREAAQWALCFDPARARDLLDLAGSLFSQLGYSFGSYLRVLANRWVDLPVREFMRDLDGLASLYGLRERSADIVIPEPLNHPQQQAYLMLACIGSPVVADQLSNRLGQILESSPHREGVTPVGAQGTPIRRYWEIATALFQQQSGAAALVADHVAAMARSQAEAVELAMSNTHLWRNAASAVDVGNIDMAGIAAIGIGRFGGEAMRGALDEQMRLMGDRGRMLMEIALEFAESTPHDDY